MDLTYYRNWLQNRLSEQRYHHSLNVAAQARSYAVLRGINPELAELAGLLHDSCKEMATWEQLQYLKAHAILLPTEILDNPPVWHGFTAALYLKEELEITEPTVLAAIAHHTTGHAAMKPLEEVLFLADYTSADRVFASADEARLLVHQNKWSQAIVLKLANGLSAALRNGRLLCSDSLMAYEYYLLQARTTGKEL